MGDCICVDFYLLFIVDIFADLYLGDVSLQVPVFTFRTVVMLLV